MASVTTPSASDVVNKTGWNRYVRGDATDEDLLAWLEELIPDAEAETAVSVGEAVYDSDALTPRQVRGLRRAVCFRTAAAALISPELERVTGTQEPLLMENAEAISEAAGRLLAMAEDLEKLCAAGVKMEESGPAFVMPSFGATAWSKQDGDTTPSERIQLNDPREDDAPTGRANE